jgi:hypothetical protein
MSLLVGALLFGSAVGQADDGRYPPPTPPTPPTMPTPPRPPRPPRALHAGSGLNIAIHDGKVQIDGLETMVDAQIDAALQGIAHDNNIPPQVRAKITARLEKVRAKVKKRLAKIDTTDPQRLGEELGQLGEDIGQEMEQFGEEMDKFGGDMDQWSKQFEKNWGKNFKFKLNDNRADDDNDRDDEDDRDDDGDDDDHDLDVPAVRDLGDLKLKAPQRDALRKLRAESDAKVANAKRDLDRAEAQLQKAIENVNASDADIARAIDAVAQQEATIRKARILTWVNARRMLDDSQRQKVEGAARKGKTR